MTTHKEKLQNPNLAKDVHYIFACQFPGVEALAYALSKALNDGSLCIDTERYIKFLEQLPAIADENPFLIDAEELTTQMATGRFVTQNPEEEIKPFVVIDKKAWLQRYYHYETSILNNIKRLGAQLHIITGGPGTGKTFSVGLKLVELLSQNSNQKIALAAPTGKASARMVEAIRDFVEKPLNPIPEDVSEKLLSLKAQTIHKLLGYIHNSVFFRHNETNRLPFDVVVIDEASMIDGAMMAKLLDAIDEKTQFFLIGDKDQLASVEAGSVFGDICRAVLDNKQLAGDEKGKVEKKVEMVEKIEMEFATGGKIEVRLKNFRAKNSPKLIEFSQKLIVGDEDYIAAYQNNEEVEIDYDFSQEKFREKSLLYLQYIKEENIPEALKKLNRIRFLCVTRAYDHSVSETNKEIEILLRHEINDPKLFSPKAGFYHNQPIIITQNDYELGLNNGDVGLIRLDENGTLKAWFETSGNETDNQLINEKVRSYPAGYLNHYETVFAMTIHKSQGSEFQDVVVLLPQKQARRLLTRELLYTGVTRASKKVLVQATAETLLHCVENVVSRASGLEQRIKDLKP